MALLLTKEIEYHKSIESLKYELKRLRDWSDVKAFNSIDSRRKGFLDFDGIMNFCRMNGYRANEGEIVAVVRRLDVDADQVINFEEFSATMNVRNPLLPPVHGDPASPVRENNYFQHTSPTKATQSRSPLKAGSQTFAPSSPYTASTKAYTMGTGTQSYG